MWFLLLKSGNDIKAIKGIMHILGMGQVHEDPAKDFAIDLAEW